MNRSTIIAVITQNFITLIDVYIGKNLEDFIFRQITEYATMKYIWYSCT